MRLHDLKGLEHYFELRCLYIYDIRTRLQGLTVLEKQIRLGCIRVGLQDLTGGNTCLKMH